MRPSLQKLLFQLEKNGEQILKSFVISLCLFLAALFVESLFPNPYSIFYTGQVNVYPDVVTMVFEDAAPEIKQYQIQSIEFNPGWNYVTYFVNEQSFTARYESSINLAFDMNAKTITSGLFTHFCGVENRTEQMGQKKECFYYKTMREIHTAVKAIKEQEQGKLPLDPVRREQLRTAAKMN